VNRFFTDLKFRFFRELCGKSIFAKKGNRKEKFAEEEIREKLITGCMNNPG